MDFCGKNSVLIFFLMYWSIIILFFSSILISYSYIHKYMFNKDLPLLKMSPATVHFWVKMTKFPVPP